MKFVLVKSKWIITLHCPFATKKKKKIEWVVI